MALFSAYLVLDRKPCCRPPRRQSVPPEAQIRVSLPMGPCTVMLSAWGCISSLTRPQAGRRCQEQVVMIRKVRSPWVICNGLMPVSDTSTRDIQNCRSQDVASSSACSSFHP